MEMAGRFRSLIITIIGLISLASADYQPFTYRKCGPENGLRIQHLSLSPTPLEIPGTVSFTMHANLTRTVSSARLDIWLWRESYFGYNIRMPCLFNIGSCTYPDLCTMNSDMIEENWAGIMTGIGEQIRDMMLAHGVNPSQCSQTPRAVRIDNYPIRMPRIPAILSWFAAGTYHAKMTVTENGNDVQVMCIELSASVKQSDRDSSGWFYGG